MEVKTPKNKKKTVSFYLENRVSEKIDERTGEFSSRSEIVNRDLLRLYELYILELRSLKLTVNEACFICDMLNGYAPATGYNGSILAIEAEDSIRYYKLDEKWDIADGKSFVEKLNVLNPFQTMVVIDAAERFWTNPGLNIEPIQNLVARIFYCQKE